MHSFGLKETLISDSFHVDQVESPGVWIQVLNQCVKTDAHTYHIVFSHHIHASVYNQNFCENTSNYVLYFYTQFLDVPVDLTEYNIQQTR